MSAAFSMIEVHRDGAALVPQDSDPEPGVAAIVEPPRAAPLALYTCRTWYQRPKNRGCDHVDTPRDLSRAFRNASGKRPIAEGLDASFWGRIARILQNEQPLPCETAPIEPFESGYRITAPGGEALVYVEGEEQELKRLVDRCDLGGKRNHQRARLLARLRDMQALVHDRAADYRQFASGKWDLFCELLDESLAAARR